MSFANTLIGIGLSEVFIAGNYVSAPGEKLQIVVDLLASMDSSDFHTGRLCFGVFQLDLKTGELTKRGMRVRLQGQPIRVLMLLLEKPGDVVTRDELRDLLWGDGTVVDFDHGLSTIINKIREKLGDSAENPRFIETIARRGYRFLAPVHRIAEPPSSLSDLEAEIAQATQTVQHGIPRMYRFLIELVAGIALLAVCAVWIFRPPYRPLSIQQVTWSGHIFPGDMMMESFPGLATDGTRIYFDEIRDGRFVLAYSLFNDNETHPLGTNSEIAGPTLIGISANGSQLLVRNHLAPEIEQPLWILTTSGSSARKVPGVLAHDATWMPKGDSILYATGDELWIANLNGSTRKLASLGGRAFWPRWSPDGEVLRFTRIDPRTHTPSLWEIRANGERAVPLLPGWNSVNGECCGNWTPDGHDYLFQAEHSGQNNIWALPESWPLRWFGHHPYQITDGPLSFSSPVVTEDGRRILAIGAHNRGRLYRYDPRQHIVVPFLPELNGATRVSFTPDGKKVAWFNEGILWASRRDGSQRIQLTSVPMHVYMMTWSPDGSQLAFMGKEAGKRWKIYTVSLEGAGATMLLPEDRSEADPSWSPDGRSIAFGRPTAYMTEDASANAISIVDVQTGKVTELPSSKGLFSPRWSPSGQYIAALSLDQRNLIICELAGKQRIEIPTISIDNPVWSADSRWIYYHSFMEPDLPIYRLDWRTGKQEKIFRLSDIQIYDAADYSFQGVASDGSPIVAVNLWSADVYQITWKNRQRPSK